MDRCGEIIKLMQLENFVESEIRCLLKKESSWNVMETDIRKTTNRIIQKCLGVK